MEISAPPQGGSSYYRCSMGRVRGGIWETTHGGHTELRSSKNVEKNLGLSVLTEDMRSSCIPGNICKWRKGRRGERFHRRIAPTQVYIVLDRRDFLVHRIQVDKEEYGDQGVVVSIWTTWPDNYKNEKLCHQSKCSPILDVYPRKKPFGGLAGIYIDSKGPPTLWCGTRV